MASITADKLFSVNGLVAVVTGGGSGIGLMIAKALAANGASKVYIVGRRKEVLDEAASACPTKNIIPLPGDVTSKESLQSIAEQVKQETGYINLLVANSGMMGPAVPKIEEGGDIKDFIKGCWETPMEEYTKTYNINITAVLFTTLAFLELLDAGNKKGNLEKKVTSQVITTSSIAGFSRLRGSSFAYNTSKAAATHLMKMLSTYLIPWNIRCNVLAPGLFPSELAEHLYRDKSIGTDENGKPIFARSFIPAQRVGDEEDMAGTILYLASKAGAFCNGVVIIVDGGRVSILTSTY